MSRLQKTPAAIGYTSLSSEEETGWEGKSGRVLITCRAANPEFAPGTHTASPGKAALDSLTPPTDPSGRGGGKLSSWGCLVPFPESAGARTEGQSHLHHQHHLSISVLHIQGGMWCSPLVLSKE